LDAAPRIADAFSSDLALFRDESEPYRENFIMVLPFISQEFVLLWGKISPGTFLHFQPKIWRWEVVSLPVSTLREGKARWKDFVRVTKQ